MRISWRKNKREGERGIHDSIDVTIPVHCAILYHDMNLYIYYMYLSIHDYPIFLAINVFMQGTLCMCVCVSKSANFTISHRHSHISIVSCFDVKIVQQTGNNDEFDDVYFE